MITKLGHELANRLCRALLSQTYNDCNIAKRLNRSNAKLSDFLYASTHRVLLDRLQNDTHKQIINRSG